MTKARLTFMSHQYKKPYKATRDPFKTKKKATFNEQLTVHKTLDTALWNIRQELMDQEPAYKQNKSDNLTKRERTTKKPAPNNKQGRQREHSNCGRQIGIHTKCRKASQR